MAQRTLFLALLVLSGCATVTPSSDTQRTNYPAQQSGSSTTNAPTTRADEGDWRAAGAGYDLAFERSSFLADTFYKNVDVLLQQVERSGVMGVNRGWEAGTRKGGDWFIEEQRFGDTIIGAGVNRNRPELIDAGLRAFEWGFQQQAADGSFPCKDPYISTAYFVAGVAHSIWLLEASGMARNYTARIATMRPKLAAAARWLGSTAQMNAAKPALEPLASRYFVVGYALGAAARIENDATLAFTGDQLVREGLAKQHTSGYFSERGGFDAGFQGEALVYLLRYHDHVATADARRALEPALKNALAWLETRVNSNGIINAANNTRSGNAERDRTGQPRRISAVAISRAFGLARYVLGDSKFENVAKTVAAARQP